MMTAETNIRDELLKQNGEGTQKMQELREKILARDEARVKVEEADDFHMAAGCRGSGGSSCHPAHVAKWRTP